MNDDFLRNARRRPPAAFEKQLRERLRQQEVASPPRRPVSWRALIVSILVGGSALAAATYLTMRHFSTLRTSASEAPAVAPATPLAQSDVNPQAAYRAGQTASTTSSAGPKDPPRSSTEAMSAPTTPTATPLRIAVTPHLAVLAEDISSTPRYASSARAEVVDADAALAALCTEGAQRPDVVIASRRISQQELKACHDSGAVTVMEATLGHMAVVVSRAKAGNSMQLSADAIMRALLKRVPSPQTPHQLIDNPYTDWNQVDPTLETQRIEVYGPPRESPEFVAFAASLLEPACDRYSWIRALRSTHRQDYEQICHAIRDDGAYRNAPRDNNFVRQRLWADPALVAIIDYPFYSDNHEDLVGSLLIGPAPTPPSIIDGSYAGSRPIHLYVSRARYVHTPAVSSFVNDYLRRQDFTRHRWMSAPDAGADSRRSYRPLQLIEVRFDEQREQP